MLDLFHLRGIRAPGQVAVKARESRESAGLSRGGHDHKDRYPDGYFGASSSHSAHPCAPHQLIIEQDDEIAGSRWRRAIGVR